MSIRKISATVGAMATAAACMVLATPVVSASPAPQCGSCWGSPKASAVSAADIAASVGSGVAVIRL